MRLIATTGRKGGVGKTTTTLALAAMLHRDGLRVLVLDLDVQGSASVALGAEPAESGSAAVLDGRGAEVELHDAGGVQVLTGGAELEDAPADADLRAVLEPFGADVVLIDCPPGHPDLDRMAVRHADAVLVCTEAHRMGVAGAARVIRDVQALATVPPTALVVGRVDTRRTLDRTAPELLRGAFAGVRVFTVRQDSALAGALNAGELPRPGGNGWRDIEAVHDWITKVVGR